MNHRIIRKSQNASMREAADLLGAIFSAELCSPSKCLWLVSPWISDVELLDNTSASYGDLTRFGKRKIRLTEVLVTLASMGTHIVIGTTTDSHNPAFLEKLKNLAEDARVFNNFTIDVDPKELLHTKAITGDDYALSGSMNITRNGIVFREELIDLCTDEEFVADARMAAFDRFGGVL